MSICIAITKKGKKCTYKAKFGNFCGVHNFSSFRSSPSLVERYIPEIGADMYFTDLALNISNDEQFDKDSITYIYNGDNDISWKQYTHDNFIGANSITYFNPISKTFCSCAACYTNIIILSHSFQKLTRNYRNKHCIDCICRYCVCNARKINREYNLYAIIVHWDNYCDCIICNELKTDSKYNGLSPILIQRRSDYSSLINDVECEIYKKFTNKLFIELMNIIKIKGLVNIVINYISVDDLESSEIVEKTHERWEN